MALDNTTTSARLNLANKLAAAEAIVRNNVQAKPVNYPTQAAAALAAAKSALDAVIAA